MSGIEIFGFGMIIFFFTLIVFMFWFCSQIEGSEKRK